MTQEQLDNDLLGTNLGGKATESSLILVCRNANHELLAEVLRQLLLQTKRRLIINIVTVPENTQSRAEVVLREPLHTNQQTATLSWPSRPAVNILVDRLPTAEVKVAYTKIGMLREGKGLS
jgi:hypothetical protein